MNSFQVYTTDLTDSDFNVHENLTKYKNDFDINHIFIKI